MQSSSLVPPAAFLVAALVVTWVAPLRAPAADAVKSPVNVGLVYSKTGLLAGYGAEYADGFAAGLNFATYGTGMAAGHKIVVAERDDAGDPGKAVAAAKESIGQGDKIIDGSTSSGVALGLARLAQDNSVLFVSGPAATDGIELRAGRIEVDVSVPLFLPTAARQRSMHPRPQTLRSRRSCGSSISLSCPQNNTHPSFLVRRTIRIQEPRYLNRSEAFSWPPNRRVNL